MPRFFVFAAAISLTVLLLRGCGDEAIEKALCKETASIACEKVYNCPAGIFLRTIYGDVNNCKSTVSVTCANSEELAGCDIDNAKLRTCKNQLSGSAGGTWPAEGTDLLRCK